MTNASEFLKLLAKTRAAKVDLEGLAEALIDEWDGVKGLAKAAKLDYEESIPGSINRGRILAYAMEIVCKASAKSAPNDPFEDQSPEDLARAISAAMQEANGDPLRT